MMDISMNTLVVTTKYYKGKVDGVWFIYDPDNLLDENEWTFGYDDNDTNDPEHEKHQKLWENRAKKRIMDLVAATTKWSVNGETDDS